MKKILQLLAMGAIVASCNNIANNEEAKNDSIPKTATAIEGKYPAGTFGYDYQFLHKYDSNFIVLKSSDGAAQIIISPKYQGKVFTSTAEGFDGKSFGWIKYSAFDKPLDPHMNGYGGEDRLWLGPEGGRFSLFFAPGVKQTFDNWHTPAAFDSESWLLVNTEVNQVFLEKDMTLKNYAGTPLTMKVQRLIALMDNAAINKALDIQLPANCKAVGFNTENSIANTGAQAWNQTSGAPCTWNLDMFAPSEKCIIIIPYINEGDGKVATTDYFGKIADDRIKWHNGILFFKADGKHRGKMGIPPARAKNVAGSYDAINKVLTVTKFDIDNKGKYLNQEWRTDRDPYSGDAMNAYNDGPLDDGTQMGPFYEIESVSPAAFLKPGEKMMHRHSVFHFTGDEAALNEIAKKVFGISLDEIEKAF